MKIAGVIIASLMAIFAITWLGKGNEFFLYKVFAPQQESVRRQVFEQSRAFNQSMVQELENMEVEYVREKDPAAKQAMASVILHRASGYNLNDRGVSADLRFFIENLKTERINAQ